VSGEEVDKVARNGSLRLEVKEILYKILNKYAANLG
jgi:hypothetical protein